MHGSDNTMHNKRLESGDEQRDIIKKLSGENF